MYVEVETDYSWLTTDVIIQRIIAARQAYEERNRKKEAKECKLIGEQDAAKVRRANGLSS
jgi:hypothetical protein